jgi:hypothetical protein
VICEPGLLLLLYLRIRWAHHVCLMTRRGMMQDAFAVAQNPEPDLCMQNGNRWPLCSLPKLYTH